MSPVSALPEFLAAWRYLNSKLGPQPVRLFVPDDNPDRTYAFAACNLGFESLEPAESSHSTVVERGSEVTRITRVERVAVSALR